MTTSAEGPTSTPTTNRAGRPVSGTVTRAVVVAVLSFALGALTSYTQGLLPDALASFANSASGWTLLTALLVYGSRVRGVGGAVLGAVSFVLLVLGYTAASDLRGLHYDPLLFGVVGVVVGPFVGLAATWLHARDLPAALGTALLAGVGIGEAAYGLTVVRDTTSPVYWIVIAAVGVTLLVGTLVRRVRGALPVAVAVLGTVVVAAVFLLAYRTLGAGLG
ncbi:DUF6518 family protein [Luteimicrobium subarcticum]|uniref:Uncharacterized protein n=1 Tax=Luteimicrobium subarcticum TaxID=620910 RepID=A0A2M8WJ37_9MICO|nr:DUF6518 family protein [Luteimicrobium subarcticum]PJI90932.1 hypothetical protein CLV34_2190 [Luteimicrobium subarcticum]